jgi:hypothetical protein
MEFIRSSWKAVVALAVPVLLGAAATILDGFGEWLTTQEGVYVGIAVGIINAVAVWLKGNVSA